jgi:hypothetical protein
MNRGGLAIVAMRLWSQWHFRGILGAFWIFCMECMRGLFIRCRSLELEKNKKYGSKLKNLKWRLKRFFHFKISKMIIFQKIFFCCVFD